MSGTEFSIIRCPSPQHEDNHPSCMYDTQTGNWHCLGCGRRGVEGLVVNEDEDREPLLVERWNPGFDFTKTWYLSGPMSGYPDYNYPAFSDAARVLRVTSVKLLSPHENPWPDDAAELPESDLWAVMMNLCRLQMLQCQGIIMLRGWPQSRGATTELKWALDKGWPVWYFNDYMLTNMNKEGA